MTRKARLWVGVTLLGVILFNYAVIGVPLARRGATIDKRAKELTLKMAKSKSLFGQSDDEYMLEIFRKESHSIDRNLLILNCAAASLAILIGSWTVFGIILHKK